MSAIQVVMSINWYRDAYPCWALLFVLAVLYFTWESWLSVQGLIR